MKLAYLLAQYLYTNKRLDLPGIGTFLMDPSVIIDSENNKQRQNLPDGISFQNNPGIQSVPELVSFISSKSGKMKPLAESDLESHLQMAHQFLNISKPFTFEGIGTLVKTKHGEFQFTPGNIIPDRAKDHSDREVHGLTKKDTVEAKYQAYLSEPVVRSRWRKPVFVLLILCGIGLAVWAGYLISAQQDEQPGAVLSEPTEVATVDSPQAVKPDSSVIKKTTPQQPNYKLVLQVLNGKRAIDRFNQLKDTKLKEDVQMETNDSLQYKLFVLLPVTSDTTRAIDSLTAFLGRKVYIERQN